MVRRHHRQLHHRLTRRTALTLLQHLDVSPGTSPGRLVAAVAAALEGSGPALLPRTRDSAPQTPTAPAETPVQDAPDGTAAVVATSGSTGRSKQVLLPAQALHASASGTHQHLGGPGQWLLALPAQHVAGFQVLVRSALSGTVPVPLPGGAFSAASLHRAVTTMTGRRRYTALVPTQLRRVLADPAATEALASLDGVLVGGAALPAPLAEAARAAGVAIVRTYGMTETAGGCVYDGRPLPGVRVSTDGDGRLRLHGPVVATGYRGDPELTRARFGSGPHGRSFLTDDAGRVEADGSLTVLGRLDDVITTGGVKVAPRTVEEALLALPAVGDAVVLAVPDEEWGQRVAAVCVPAPAAAAAPDRPGTDAVRQALRDRLPPAALPRQLVWLDAVPVLASGKPDRVALVRMLAAGDGTM